MLPLLRLAEIRDAETSRVGGKAAHLGRLASRGLPVPDGFVLPVQACVMALGEADLLDAAQAVRQSAEPARVDALRQRIQGMTLPEPWDQALVRAARELVGAGGLVAVRSSGVEEDGRVRSFAGQHETVLGVTPEAVPKAIRACWASLYAASALAYRGGRGPEPGAMAVIVQRLVEPTAAGVLFTVNPLNGSWREMVVEAVWGLGEGLVGGQLAPHWYLVRRPHRAPRPVQRVLSRVRLQVMQEDLPPLPERFVAGANGQLRREPVPPSLRDRRTLSQHDVLRLCRLGLRVEALLGEPQDVEWALDATGALQVLQARPITTTGTPRTRKDVLWTRRFIGERWPEPATPLGWSVIAPLLEWFIAYPGVQQRYLGGGPALKLVRGRPYLNATVFRHLGFKLPGAPPPRFMLELVPPQEEAEWRRHHAVLPDLAVYAGILRTTLQERRWERFRWNPFTNHREWDAFRERLEADLPDLARVPTSEPDALRLVGLQIERVRAYVAVHICSLLFANLFYQLLEGALAVWAPGRRAALMEKLATCPPGNLTLETNAALWQLAHLASEEDLTRLQDGDLPGEDSPFSEALRRFLEAYGHRSEASWEICAPRWGRAPERLVPLLRAQRSVGSEDPAVRAKRQQRAYEDGVRELNDTFGGSATGVLLGTLVFYTRRYLLLRENQRFWFDKLLYASQQTLLWLGRRFVERGWLDHAESIAFLTWEEIQGLVEETLPPESVGDWVARRRAQRQADLQAEPPVFLVGEDPGLPVDGGHRLQGLGISPGRARGRVRVVRTLGEGHLLEPGEILVTRAVDPGWTPLFLTAAGVVLEMGSVLSHGAVVAREYKVPAVVNLEGVTAKLTDGQEVTIDGTRGVVWIHP